MKSKRIYLRALEPEDYKTSVRWRNDDEVTSMLGGQKFFVSGEVEKEWVLNTIHQNKEVKLAICTLEENRYIGNVYLTDIDLINRKGRSHILIGEKEYWNGGYGTEAMRLLLDYAFNHKNLRRVEARILADNIASQKMHEKLGYIKEGTLREAVYKEGVYKDLIFYALLKKEYNPSR